MQPPSLLLASLLLLVLLLLELPHAAGLVDDALFWKVQPGYTTQLTEFCFGGSGRYSLSVELTSVGGDPDGVAPLLSNGTGQLADPDTEGVWYVICTDDQLAAYGKPVTVADAAELPVAACPFDRCWQSVRAVAAATELAHDAVDTEQHLNFFVATCGVSNLPAATVIRGKVSFTMVGRSGAHLSCDHVLLPIVFLSCAGCWVLCLGMWCFNWLSHRKQNVVLQVRHCC